MTDPAQPATALAARHPRPNSSRRDRNDAHRSPDTFDPSIHIASHLDVSTSSYVSLAHHAATMLYRSSLATRLYPLFCALRIAWGSPLRQTEAMSAMMLAKHGKPEEPTDSPAYMFKLIGSIGLILLGGLFAGESDLHDVVPKRARGNGVLIAFLASPSFS